jgi:hypothetical protein
VVPPPLDPNRSQPRLYPALALRLHAASLLAAWTSRCDRPRGALQSCRGYAQYALQQRGRYDPPRRQHAVFVFGQAVITMCSHMLQQTPAELNQRLYDLIREVVGVHVGLPLTRRCFLQRRVFL